MAPDFSEQLSEPEFLSDPHLFQKSLHSGFLLRPVTTMNPTQPNVSNAREICLLALEQACADSLAKQDNTQKQLDRLLNGFQQLEKLILVETTPPISPEIQPSDIIPIQATSTRQQPPPPALPNEYDGDCSKGQAFLISCQMYICLCPDSCLEEQVKITWALSYMKSG